MGRAVTSRVNTYVPSTASTRAEHDAPPPAMPNRTSATSMHDRPAERVLREELAVAVSRSATAGRTAGMPAVGRQDRRRAGRVHLPEVGGLVAVPRERGVHEVVDHDRHEDRGTPQRAREASTPTRAAERDAVGRAGGSRGRARSRPASTCASTRSSSRPRSRPPLRVLPAASAATRDVRAPAHPSAA